MVEKEFMVGALLVAGCLLGTGTAAAEADPELSSDSISSLSMRGSWTGYSWIPKGLHWMQPAEPTTPAPAAPAATPAPVAAPAPAPAPAANVEATAEEAPKVLSDEEILAAALAEAEQAGGEAVEADGQVINITGSLIERRETTTMAPIAVVGKEELVASGKMTIGDILQDLPAQANGINTNVNNGGDGSTRINLRGLGTSRTLTLVNGRRHVPGGTGADASVDLNAIPLAAIERIEVLKDGASAIYGSDAIGGVVNIITRRSMNGSEASIYTGNSQRNDGAVVDVSFATGVESKKGGMIFSAGYSKQSEIFAGDRDFSTTDRFYDYSTGEVASFGSSRTPEGTIGDRSGVVCGADTCWRDPATGEWVPFDFGGNSDDGSGHLYNYQPVNYLTTPMTRYNLFTTGEYKLKKHVNAFFEASYVNRNSQTELAPEPLDLNGEGLVLSKDSVYNPYGMDLSDVRRRLVEAGGRITDFDSSTFRVVLGLDGDIPVKALEGWRWETSFNYGKTKATTVKRGNQQKSALAAAVGPSYMDDNGVAQCGSPGNPGPTGCVPLNLLGGEGTITPEMLKYLVYTGNADGYSQQEVYSVSASGPVAETPWGGDVTLALGASHRREGGGFFPDPLTASGDTSGNAEESTEGEYNVTSGFGEVSVVPITGHEMAEWLEFSGAVRAVKYNTFGSSATWKTGALWKIRNGVSVRSSYGTAFRAPNVGDLYSGQSDSAPTVFDPCDTSRGPLDPIVAANCAQDGVPADYKDERSQLDSVLGGNEDLSPETAKVLTAGIVYEPTFLDGLGLTVDYYNIKVNNTISRIGESIILSNCYAQESRSDCDLVTRRADSFLTKIQDTQNNVGKRVTSGIDFAINYRHEVAGVGRFRHNFEGSRLLNFDETQSDGRVVKGAGNYDLIPAPLYKFNASTQWNKDAFGVGANARYIHSFKECDVDCQEGTASDGDRRVSINVTGDVFGTYNFKTSAGESTVALGVNNVTDRDPSRIFAGRLATSDASTYDFMGRYFYLRFNQKF